MQKYAKLDFVLYCSMKRICNSIYCKSYKRKKTREPHKFKDIHNESSDRRKRRFKLKLSIDTLRWSSFNISSQSKFYTLIYLYTLYTKALIFDLLFK